MRFEKFLLLEKLQIKLLNRLLYIIVADSFVFQPGKTFNQHIFAALGYLFILCHLLHIPLSPPGITANSTIETFKSINNVCRKKLAFISSW